MTAMAGPRQVRTRKGEIYSRPIAANAKIFQGAIICLSAGYAVKATTATGLIVDGVARESVDNTGGSNGAQRIESQPDTIYCKNSASGDAITIADVGTDCYLVDDQTVAKTNGGGTRSVAGKIKDVDAATGEVLVRIG